MELGHIGIGVTKLKEMKIFYDAIIDFIGLEYLDSSENSVRYGQDGSALLYFSTNMKPITGLHICFDVDSRKLVDDFYATALQAGGRDHGAPGVREHYSLTYYAAYVIDPEGNNIELVCRD